jgi:hypothetical protein
MTPITNDQIDAARSPAGGFTRATLAQWGVPWPPPHGWRKTIVTYGIPYAAHPEALVIGGANVTQDSLHRMVERSVPQLIDGEPFGVEGQIDIDPAKLLGLVVTAVINHGQARILYEFPDVLAFFGSRLPTPSMVTPSTMATARLEEAMDPGIDGGLA